MLYDNDKKKSKLVARELDEEELVVAAILVLQLFIRYDTNNMFFFQSQFQLWYIKPKKSKIDSWNMKNVENKLRSINTTKFWISFVLVVDIY